MYNDYDYIIVGQGLAGTCLSHSLRKRGQKVLVIGNSKGHSSSLIAGGLFNPVTGRKMVLTWLANELFPLLQEYYAELEAVLKVQFILRLPLYRPFLSIEEQNEWQGKSADEKYKSFIQDVLTKENDEIPIANTFGGLELTQTGAIRTKILLTEYRKLLLQGNEYLDEEFNYNELNLDGPNVVYRDYRALKVIFAEGTGVVENPWFNYVKINRLKGEVLEIRTKTLLNKIVSRGVFILPLPGDENRCVVGSTYEHNNFSWDPSEKGREAIEEKLKSLLNCEFKVVDHRAGLRPTVVDRRPVLGNHPNNSKLAIFNGLGTKGVSLAPYFAEHYANHLLGGNDLLPEVNVSRFN